MTKVRGPKRPRRGISRFDAPAEELTRWIERASAEASPPKPSGGPAAAIAAETDQ